MIVVPYQCVRTDIIEYAAMTEDLFFRRVIVKILKANFLSLVDRFRDRIHNVQKLMVFRLQAVRDIEVTRHLFRLPAAHETLKLPDERGALVF